MMLMSFLLYLHIYLLMFLVFIIAFTIFFFVFFGTHSQHIKVPTLGVQSVLHLPEYSRATAMLDLSLICNLHQSSWQHKILNLQRKARNQTHVLMDMVCYFSATMGTHFVFLLFILYTGLFKWLLSNFCYFLHLISSSFFLI